MPKPNQTPEQAARDNIDKMLSNAGWIVQDKKKINWTAGPGIAVREYQTDAGPADYVLFADRKPVGVIEAKPEEWGQKITTVEDQSGAYAAAELKWVTHQEPLPFIYESTGVVTRFTDARDPKPRSREVFSFPQPETLQDWRNQPNSLRARLQGLPALDPAGLRDCQINAIEKLDVSFKDNRPRALIQMATGSGKTYTAITSIYRLLKHAGAQRILFLVDTKNLGEQAEQEFMAYTPSDDNRKFTELNNVQRLKSSVTVRSCRYFGPEVAAARRSVRPVPDRACGSASVRANRVAMRFQCPTPFLTLAITPLRSASIAIWQVLRTAPYRHDRTVTIVLRRHR